MKKNLFLVLFFLVFLQHYAQLSGNVNYEVNFDTTTINKDIASGKLDTIPKKKNVLIRLLSGLQTQNCQLQFNKTESLYTKVETMDVDNGELNFTKILIGEKVVYTNVKSKSLLIKNNIFNEVYLINETNPIKWTLLNEQKKIGNYLCYKAIAEREIHTLKKGVIKKNIIAWYAPDIPFRFGPSIYSNLPGLILELNDGQLVFTSTEISFSSKDRNIKKPTKGIKITRTQFEKTIRKKTKALMH